jgi:peptide/nickel transport system permease protein
VSLSRRTRQHCRTDRAGVFAARIVVGDDHVIGVRHGGCAHQRPLAGIAITASTDDPLSVLLAAAPLAIATTIIGSIAYLGRILRVGLIEVMAADFVERLHLSGIPRWRILWLHALPAAMIPGLSAAALYAASLVSGVVVVELVFAYPGVGAELVRAVTRREVHVVQAIALAAAVCVVLFNLAADLGIAALDPRTRRS